MKICRLRIRTLLALGIGFLLGSRAGRGPWDAVAAKVADLRSRRDGSSELYLSNGDGTAPVVNVVNPAGETRPGDRLPFSSI